MPPLLAESCTKIQSEYQVGGMEREDGDIT